MDSKYQSPGLFHDILNDVIDQSLARLRLQYSIYWIASQSKQRKMECRGLLTAAFTLNATAIWTAKLLLRGKFSMITQRRFFQKRWRSRPGEWGENAKSALARSWCGYSIGADAVCIDRHMERIKATPKDAPDQWEQWFRTYGMLYGPGEAEGCIRWHVDLLDWIALISPKPKPWK